MIRSQYLVAALLLAWPAFAQTDSRAQSRSYGLTQVPCGPDAKGFCMWINGYFWIGMNQHDKTGFLTAYGQGVEMVVRAMHPKAEDPEIHELHSAFQPLVGPGENAAGVDLFYAMPENLGVPIARALQVLAWRKAGASAEATLKQAEEYRKEASFYK